MFCLQICTKQIKLSTLHSGWCIYTVRMLHTSGLVLRKSWLLTFNLFLFSWQMTCLGHCLSGKWKQIVSCLEGKCTCPRWLDSTILSLIIIVNLVSNSNWTEKSTIQGVMTQSSNFKIRRGWSVRPIWNYEHDHPLNYTTWDPITNYLYL